MFDGGRRLLYNNARSEILKLQPHDAAQGRTNARTEKHKLFRQRRSERKETEYIEDHDEMDRQIAERERKAEAELYSQENQMSST